MCGFSGVVHWDRQPVAADEPARMVEQLKHRGPDRLSHALPEPGVGLGHARLRVIDLSSAADQPMSNEGAGLWLCFNGEIYNFQELRQELQAKGLGFRTRSDTEVILRAYEAWGTQAIPRLDGMFAFALWDARRRELLLVRDRTGKKPLYYWANDRCLTFGSEIKALLAHRHVPREVHEQALGPLLAFGSPPAGLTCYREIRQVPPAAFLLFRAGEPQPQPRTYWRLPPPSSNGGAGINDPQAVREVRDLLTESVRRRLISDVPLGAFLSGGLDSSIIVSILAKIVPASQLQTFSIRFDGDSRYNETRFAQQVAARLGTRHHVFTVTEQSFGLLERLVWHHDQPFGDSSAVPTYLLSQLARSKVTVALTGDGGDELFAGYDRFLACLWAERIPHLLRVAGSGLARILPAGSSQKSRWTRLRRFLLAAHLPLAQRLLAWARTVPDPGALLRPEILLKADSTPSSTTEVAVRGGSPLQRILRLNFHDYLPNDLHVKLDRCSMAHGLECRSPFLDTRLIEWSFALPDRLKWRNGVTKWILREAFRSELPPSVLGRPKMGFGVPLETWFRRSWKEPLHDLLAAGQPRLLRYLRPEPLRALLLRHDRGLEDAGQQLWLLLTLEVWLRSLERG